MTVKWIYKYDEKFNYMPGEEIQVEDDAEAPEFYCEVKPPDGLYLAKFNPQKSNWYESATPEYIESLRPPEPEPDPTELLKKQNALLSYKLAQIQAEIEKLKGGADS